MQSVNVSIKIKNLFFVQATWEYQHCQLIESATY